MTDRLNRMAIRLLLVPRIRSYFCKLRWLWLRKNIRFFEKPAEAVSEHVVRHNLSAFKSDAAFGAGARMDILMYPLAALAYPTPSAVKVLIIGPRTEDDIFLAKALGFSEVRGLDLFTYSPFIDIGDMHNMTYADEEFDAVVLGWVLAYSGDPAKAAEQSKRILKKGGHLAIGWEWVPNPDAPDVIRGNFVNSPAQMQQLFDCDVVFVNDPPTQTNHHKSMIFKK